MDEPINVEIDETVTVCDCCGKQHLKRTIHLFSEEIGSIHIGVICASRWFELNLTGNPFYAAAKLDRHISKYLEDDELETIIEDIKEASQEW